MRFRCSFLRGITTIAAMCAVSLSVIGVLGASKGIAQTAVIALKLLNQQDAQATESLEEAGRLHQQGKEQYQSAEFQAALESFQQALRIYREVNNQQGEGSSLVGLASACFGLGRYSQAIESFQQAIAIAQETSHQEAEQSSFVGLGNVYQNLGQYSQAIDSYQRALSIGQEIDHPRTIASSLNGLGNAYFRLGQNSQAIEAYQLALDAARSMGDRQREASALGNLGSIYFKLGQYSRAIETYQQSLAIKREISDPQREANDLNNLGNAYFMAGQHTQAMESYQQSLAISQNIGDRQGESEVLNNNEKIVFIPHNSLFLVPFPALQDQDGTYLIEKHTILTAPSIQVLGLTYDISQQRLADYQAIPMQADSALIVGNPTMPAMPVLPGEPPLQPPPLPGAEREALEIAQMFDTEALIGLQATETAVAQQMSNARIVHLATHGFLNYGQSSEFGIRDIPGAVVLAPSGEDDGLLSASEILELDLNAELVVLSACDTGRGNITGDGVIGLSRSLIAAGTPSVIVSLWQVPDDSTAMLMTEFYRQLQQNPNKAQALRQAMLATMAEHPAVRDWAAFTLIGEAE